METFEQVLINFILECKARLIDIEGITLSKKSFKYIVGDMHSKAGVVLVDDLTSLPNLDDISGFSYRGIVIKKGDK